LRSVISPVPNKHPRVVARWNKITTYNDHEDFTVPEVLGHRSAFVAAITLQQVFGFAPLGNAGLPLVRPTTGKAKAISTLKS
jgi:hypothetical protein